MNFVERKKGTGCGCGWVGLAEMIRVENEEEKEEREGVGRRRGGYLGKNEKKRRWEDSRPSCNLVQTEKK